MHGRLSSFQKTMLQWDALHPYNAVHAVRLAGSAPLDRLEAVLSRAVASRELAGLSIRPGDGTYVFRGGVPHTEVRVLPVVEEDGLTSLAAEMERQLNTPFPFVEGEVFEPLRFFVIPTPGAFWLGLTYFHPIADAESIVRLLRSFTEFVQGRSDPSRWLPLDRYPPCPEQLALRHPLRYLRALATVPGALWGARRACRVNLLHPADQRNEVRVFSVGSECLETMRRVGRAWGVTFNDLILTALLRALSPLAERRRQARRRREIAVGVIVNLRKELGMASPESFGVMLGSFRVAHEVPESMALRELAAGVSRQTRRAKRTRCSWATSAQFRLGRWVFRRFSTERRHRFYPKHYPLWGGVTNMQLDSLWPLQLESGVLDYHRVVSTGPATPLVLSCTTALNRVHFAISYRSAVFSQSELVAMSERFVGCLKQLSLNP